MKTSCKENSMAFTDRLMVEGVNFKGFGIIPYFVMRDSELTVEAKAIYLYLSSFAGNGAIAFPTREKILADLLIGKNAYYRHFKLLIEHGYITAKQSMQERSRFARNIYTIVSNPKKLQYANNTTSKDNGCLRYTGLKSCGYGMIPKAVMIDTRLSIKAKCVYGYFSSLTGAGNTSFPQLKQILHELQLNKDSYYKYLNELLTLNYLVIKQRRVNGKMSVNDYYLIDTPNWRDGKAPLSKNEDTVKAEEQPFPKNSDTVKMVEQPLPKNSDTVKMVEQPLPKNSDTVKTGEQPFPKNSDTVKEKEQPFPKNGDTVKTEEPSFPKNGDTVKRDTVKRDTVKWDTVNGDTNITNIKSTNIKSTIIHSFYQGGSMPICERGNDVVDVVEKVKTELLTKKKLPYTFKKNERFLTTAIHLMTNWNQLSQHGYKDELRQSIYKLFNEALIQMCMTDQMQLKGSYVTYAKVIDRLNERIVFEDNDVDLSEFMDAVMNKYYNAIVTTEIKNPMKYMEACIWDLLLTGNVEMYASLNRDFGITSMRIEKDSGVFIQPDI